MMMRFVLALPLLCAWAFPAAAQVVIGASEANPAAAPDKSGYTFFNPTPDNLLRSFDTDRPTRSNVPVTVDAGHVQYETDLVNYVHSNVGGVSTRLYAAFDPVLKLGVTNWADIEVQYGGYNWLDGNRSGISARGSGDLTLRAKINLFGNEGGPAMALIPYVKFPTAVREVGNGHTEGGVIVPISVPAPFGFTVLVVPEVDVLKNGGDAGRHFNFTQLINLSHAIGPKVTVYGELYSAIGTDRHSPPVYTFDAAVAYELTSSFELDVGTNIGLNRNAPNLQLYTGVSQRF